MGLPFLLYDGIVLEIFKKESLTAEEQLNLLISLFFLKSNNVIDKISKNTLFIIFFHFLILLIGRMIGIPKIVPYMYSSTGVLGLLGVCILYSFIDLIICYFTILIMEKYCLILLGKTNLNQKENI